MLETLDISGKQNVFQYLLRLGDDVLVLGHRLSEWCGHAPILEEDIALGNIALDCLGQAQALLRLAGEVEGQGRTEDTLAYLRDGADFRNVQLVERPNGDFAVTVVRQLFFSAYAYFLYEELTRSTFAELAGIASKAVKETAYHLRHARQWVIRLGDGTAESKERVSAALEELWGYTPELFEEDSLQSQLEKLKIAPELSKIKSKWQELIRQTLTEATLTEPDENRYISKGGRLGIHTEHLGHMLAEMQVLPRANPGAIW